MNPRKNIVILTLSVGSGHVRAAEVIGHALQDGADNIDVQILDALEHGKSWFRRLYVDPYWWMLRHAPGLWRRVFERRKRKAHRATAPHWLFRRGCAEVFRRLRLIHPSW